MVWVVGINPNEMPESRRAITSATFRHDLSRDQLLELSNPSLLNWVQEQARCDDSCDLAFALRLMLRNEGEVALACCCCARGDTALWRRITQAVVRADWFWPDEIVSLQWRIHVDRESFPLAPYSGEDNAFWISSNGDTNIDCYDDWPAAIELKKRLLELHHYFDPTLDLDFCAGHAELHQQAGHYGGVQCIFDVAKPSMHEQIEAMLILRDWNSANGSPLAL